ncbi:MAG: hypothetical protein HQL74_02255 [Magnetococcales bacterium]|nr:hypothetical protein [Magnetococcales bacterium]
MPAIKPISVQDCIAFTQNNRDEIKEGIFDVHIQTFWIADLPGDVLLFLLSHCPSTKKVVGTFLNLEHPHCAAILTQLAQDEDLEIRQCVAGNPHTPQEQLVRLTGDYFKEVRLAAAKNPALPVQTIETLARENSTTIREAVLENDHLTLKIINLLASDRSERVQKRVAQRAREASHPPLVQLFARCAIPDVRISVCANPTITLDILEILYRDDNRDVHRAAITRMEAMAASPKTTSTLLTSLAAFPQETIGLALARNPNTPMEVLLALTQQKNSMVKMTLLGHSRLDMTILQTLARDTDDRVRTAVASFPQAPESILTLFAEDPSLSVRNALAANPAELKRRQQNRLCLNCGQTLSRINQMMGSHCLKCSKQKVMDSFTR